MNCKSIPIIKENRLEKIIGALKCFDIHKFDREKQVSCVLGLYDPTSKLKLAQDKNPKEKGIFRGMTITTLGKLGLIVSHGKTIEVSENGNLMIRSLEFGDHVRKITSCSVIVEIDEEIFHFLELIKQNGGEMGKVQKSLTKHSAGCNDRQISERFRRWLNILKASSLVAVDGNKINLNLALIDQLRQVKASVIEMKREFRETLLLSYSELAATSNGIVEIEELRRVTSTKFLENYSLPIPRNTFDSLLVSSSNDLSDYLITFGHSMGKGEKLLKIRNEYYRTIYIKAKGVQK